MHWRPSASRLALERRAQILSDIRSFFAERDVMEVETPILSSAANTDPNIVNMHLDSEDPRYLRTSPEHAMKRLLVSGVNDIYELGRVFRQGEKGIAHNPEFTLLEWYRKNVSYLSLAEETVQLLKHCGRGKLDAWQTERYSYRQLFIKHSGLDPFHTSDLEWENLAQERGLQAGRLSEIQWQDLFLTHIIQPALDPEVITIVFDYPTEHAALARIRKDDHNVAERFEIYLGQLELANGYQELCDASEQKARFERDLSSASCTPDRKPTIDHQLIAALEHGLPECSGVALGVDRLLMRLMDLDSIDAVIAFPYENA